MSHKKVQYYSTICPEDNKPSVYIRTWDEEGIEHVEFVQSYANVAAADKASAKYQAKEDKICEEEKRKNSTVNLLNYLLTEFGFTGEEKAALKFAKRYLSSDQISNVMRTGKTK